MFRKPIFFIALAVTALAIQGCGGDGNGGGGDGDLNDAQSITVTGVNTDADFATTGRFTVGFTARDADGDPLLASTLSGPATLTVSGTWLHLQAQTTGAVDCEVTEPGSTDCTLDDLSSSTPSGSGDIVGAVLIDDSGSMSTSDPDDDRAPAANTFINAVCDCDNDGTNCADDNNHFAALDFGAGANLTFSDTRGLLTAEGSAIADLPYPECSNDNVAEGQLAVNNQVQASGGTPLYESVLEVCQNMVDEADGILNGLAPALLVLSDGQPDSDTNKDAAEACISDNNITACTVGLGPASEVGGCSCGVDQDCLDNFTGNTCVDGLCVDNSLTCSTSTDCFGARCIDGFCEPAFCGPDDNAVQALKDLANAGRCVYSAATDAAALDPIFEAIGAAVSTGQNFAEFAVDPVPVSGTTVNGTLTVGDATANFSFIAP